MKRLFAIVLAGGAASAAAVLGLGVVSGAPAYSAAPGASGRVPRMQPSASGSVSASASASAAVPPRRFARVNMPELADVEIPTTRSGKPKRDEWQAAQPVRVSQPTPRAKDCTAVVLREYMKVSCPKPMAGIRQFIGGIKDVELFIYPKGQNLTQSFDVFTEPNGGDIVFPLRRGENYMFQFFEISQEYDGGFGVSEHVLVDISWAGSRKAPTVVLR